MVSSIPAVSLFSSSHIAALLAWSDTLQTINFIREAFPVLYIPGPFRTSRFPHHPDNLDFELCDGLHRRHLLHSCYSGQHILVHTHLKGVAPQGSWIVYRQPSIPLFDRSLQYHNELTAHLDPNPSAASD
jgi:hypothetical protein